MLFATFIVLLLVPAYNLVLHDVLALLGRSEAVVLPAGDDETSEDGNVPQPAQ